MRTDVWLVGAEPLDEDEAGSEDEADSEDEAAAKEVDVGSNETGEVCVLVERTDAEMDELSIALSVVEVAETVLVGCVGSTRSDVVSLPPYVPLPTNGAPPVQLPLKTAKEPSRSLIPVMELNSEHVLLAKFRAMQAV
ncbi:hypothetical protein LTR36_002504 [Oleoguttula mirabilis]|uniref:Uncharacterized protein n=1 Tax=Oleoguttula mirabilis TaxID=1507867 RepID=A0AAV9JN48_9PEZI|nr:hypothetical protein LTR36_002504 [Oleoguttula mirabilis]